MIVFIGFGVAYLRFHGGTLIVSKPTSCHRHTDLLWHERGNVWLRVTREPCVSANLTVSWTAKSLQFVDKVMTTSVGR